ncbi:MAG: MMPL family transporter [Pseudomonadota bacterium]
MHKLDLPGRLARAQVRRPLAFVAAVIATSAAAVLLASGLEFDASYYALMPPDTPEVREADSVREQTGGNRQLVVAIEGEDPEKRLAFGRKLAGRIEKVEQVRYATIEFPVDFFMDRALWLLDLETLDRLTVAVEDAVRLSRQYSNPLAPPLDEEEAKKEVEAAWQEAGKIAGKKENDLFEGGVLTSRDGRYTFILAMPWVRVVDVKGVRAMFRGIDEAVEELGPEAYGVKVRYAGKFTFSSDLHETLLRDMGKASLIALFLCIALVSLVSRRPAAPLFIAAGLIAGAAWTLAVAELLVGSLNILSGMLVAVLIGLGVDFGIHIVIRYGQERRREGLLPAEAIERAVRGTLAPSLTAALTTSGTFFAFMIADFRGFSEFGLLAGIGVLFMLLATFLMLPPLLFMLDRKKGNLPALPGQGTDAGGAIPRPGALAAVLVMTGLAVYGGLSVGKLNFRNDYRMLRGESEVMDFFEYVDENISMRFDPTVVLVGSVKDARSVAAAAREVSDRRIRKGGTSYLDRVFSAASLLPADVDAHAQRIGKLRDILLDPKLDRALKKGGKQADELKKARRMVGSEPWGMQDIPDEIRRMLTTLDGKKLAVLMWCRERLESDTIALAWEEELGQVRRRLGESGMDFELSTETVMPAWVYRMIVADTPPMIILASLIVLACILVHLRNIRRTLAAGGSLAVAILGFVALIHATGMEINMFNLIAIPCIIGIGIDGIIHVYHRYLDKGKGSMLYVLRRTGVAVLLTTLTTGVGFGSALIAHHAGLRSLATLAAVGLGFTLVTAVVFFPSLISLFEKKE